MIVREGISFERGLDPKKAMNIGMDAQIHNFMEENSNEMKSNWLSNLLQTSYENKGLDPEVQEAWIKHLLKYEDFNNYLDENDYYLLREKGISWIPYIPLSPVSDSFKYELVGNQYFITFNEWGDFIDIIDKDSRNGVSEEFLEAVLEGNAFSFFEAPGDYVNDITDFTGIFKRIESKGEGLDTLKRIKNKAIELGGDPDNMKNLESLMNEINDNSDLEDLKEAIARSIIEAQEIADENEAYRHIINEIKNYFEIEGERWIDGNLYKAKISKKGVEKISYALSTGDEKLGYSAPYNGYSGSISEEDLLDSLDNKLRDLE